MVLDCRWVGIGGAGRLAELLLQGFARQPPAGRWILWGPAEMGRWVWPGAEVAVAGRDPRAGFGQRCWFEVPKGDLVVFMHQQRPQRPMPSITLILDTIPLRFASSRLDRAVKRLFLRRVVATSQEIVTISQYSRACIERDLGVAAGTVSVLSPPADVELATRVAALRCEAPSADKPAADAALYIGAFLPHKNLDRLVAAFERTAFCAGGGRLWLVGGSPAHQQDLAARITPEQRRFVELRGRCTQDELDRLLATALFLVQPSLEEGFGLPVWEALSCGLPVCVSDGGALPEITAGLAEPFRATSVESMAVALDACAEGASRGRDEGRPGPSPGAGGPRFVAPTAEQYARQFEEIVWRNLR